MTLTHIAEPFMLGKKRKL